MSYMSELKASHISQYKSCEMLFLIRKLTIKKRHKLHDAHGRIANVPHAIYIILNTVYNITKDHFVASGSNIIDYSLAAHISLSLNNW